MALRLFLVLAAVVGGAGAQSVQVYSEFQRIDPFGAVVAADHAEQPREILSPALARNAYATFQIVVTVPKGQDYGLYLAQNPENAVRATIYQPTFVKRGSAWIPDALEPLKLLGSGQVPSLPSQVPGQAVTVLWLDLWVGPDAPVRRTRLEIQLHVGEHWVIYPMELRITAPVVPTPQGPLEPLAPIEQPASASAAAPLRAYVCTAAGSGEEGPLTVRRLIRRNARQDIALARSLEPRHSKLVVVTGIVDALGGADRAQWCRAPAVPPQLGAEWYLRVRGHLYRAALRSIP
jgi:hypothetical protein